MYLPVLFGFVLGILVLAVLVQSVRNAERTVHVTSRSNRPVPAIHVWAVKSFAKAVRPYGYRIDTVEPSKVVLVHVYRSMLTWFFAIVFFPLGLILLVAFRRKSTLTINIWPAADGGTEMLIAGEAPGTLAKQLELSAEPIAAFPRIPVQA